MQTAIKQMQAWSLIEVVVDVNDVRARSET